ncbi:MAG: type IX secretion system ring protein PorN/GldN [Bacteroidales bacterium]
MKKTIISGFLTLLFGVIINAQTFKDIYQKSIPDNPKINYPFLREADAFWSKIIYRVIDLRERINHPLYYPTVPLPDGRKSFINIILDELKAGRLTAYDYTIVPDTTPVSLTYADIEAKMGARLMTTQIQDINTGMLKDTVIPVKAEPSDVKQLLLYEQWFFDKKHSKLDVRIIGICPLHIRFDEATGTTRKTAVCWLRYDDLRDILAKKEVFNPYNDSQRLSFDDLFMLRRFNSYISAESNVYNDRVIIEYTTGKDAMFEAERIKMQIFNFEHDLWEY